MIEKVTTMDHITLKLPEPVLRRATETATLLEQSLEEVLAAVIETALPDVSDAPLDLQRELLRMTWLPNDELWSIAKGQMGEEAQQRMLDLVEQQQQQGAMTTQAAQAIEELRKEYGRITLRKARAYALLSLRSGYPLLKAA